MGTPVEKHFDNIAKEYDFFKQKNWYYYKNLKNLYKELIPSTAESVLEIGCGTGDLIYGLNCKKKTGIDISPEMIAIAKQKYPMINFKAVTIENFDSNYVFDYIFLADVIEHLEDISSNIKAISKICSNETKIIFTYANPLWEFILLFLEKLSLKMPEGPHYRIPYFKFKEIFEQYGFITIKRDWRLIFPANIPLFSNFVNRIFYKIPLLKRLGMLEYIIIVKK